MSSCGRMALSACLGLSLAMAACGGGGNTQERSPATGDDRDTDSDEVIRADDAGRATSRDAQASEAGAAGRDATTPPRPSDEDPSDAPLEEEPADTCDASAAPTIPKLALRAVATGLSSLVFAAQPPGSSDWYLVQQTGQIRVLRAGEKTVSSTPFLDVSAQVRLILPDDERGLLGLAFAPDYAQSGKFYVMMTPTSNADTLHEFQRSSADPYVADKSPTRTLLTLPASAFNHNGGHVVFGPDGKLYIATGDGGGACNSDKPGAPQNESTLFGKLLRIDPQSGRSEVVHSGLRNPYRFSFDRTTGDVYIGDVGQDAYEELDFAPAGTTGLNFGWGAYEANAMTCGGRRLQTGMMHTPPIFGVDRRASATGPFRDYKSIIGGHVYRGRAIPALRGTYLFGDYKGARMGALVQCGSKTSAVTPIAKNRDPNAPNAAGFSALAGAPRLGDLTAIVTDNEGEIYLVANRGVLLQVVPGT